MLRVALLAAAVLSFFIAVCGIDLNAVLKELNTHYDSQFPPLTVRAQELRRPVNANAYHSKRCSLAETGSSVQAFKAGRFASYAQQATLVSTPCLFSDSLGNWLSNYFETVLCAKMAKLHYMAVAKVWEPSTNDTAVPFVQHLPALIPHSNPVAASAAVGSIAQTCPCPTNCHERPNALWIRDRETIKKLMWGALNYHIRTLKSPTTVVLKTDISNQPVGKTLPLIPDVAIHYRCGDNFVGHYGFLPFSAFKALVPVDAKTIYVLADKRGRKTDLKQHRAAKCDAIFTALFEFLTQAFPGAAVVIRRGDDLYLDLLRLASARTTICSVSSFCLWPAVVHNHTAHFPVTKLVVRGDSGLDLGFRWISRPKVVLGAPFEHLPTAQLVNVLKTM